MNPDIIPLVQAAAKSKFALFAVLFYLICSLAAMFFKKERYAVRVGAFLALVCLCGFIVARLMSAPQTSAGPTNANIQVQGNGNGTAVGQGSSVHVASPPKDDAKK